MKLHNGIKLIIFDLDYTLLNKMSPIDKYIVDIVYFFKKKGIKIALASLNVMAPYFLQKNGIAHLFDYIEHRQLWSKSTNKKNMFSNIKSFSQIDYDNMLLFDDSIFHSFEARNLGIRYVVVDENKLLTWKDVKKGLLWFSPNRKRSRSCEW